MVSEREQINDLARSVAAMRFCSCGGASNCGCWNLALRVVNGTHESVEDGLRKYAERHPAS